jgi:protein SCO1/2
MKPLHQPVPIHASECEAVPCPGCGRGIEGRHGDETPPHGRRVRLRFVAALCALVLGTVGVDARARAGELPGDSTYHLALSLVDQDARPFVYADGRGRARVVSMFYTSCKYVCPLIIDTLLKTERELAVGQRARLDVLLVSLDPDNDTPDALKRVADKRHLDTARWRLARADTIGVRRLAALLGIQ